MKCGFQVATVLGCVLLVAAGCVDEGSPTADDRQEADTPADTTLPRLVADSSEPDCDDIPDFYKHEYDCELPANRWAADDNTARDVLANIATGDAVEAEPDWVSLATRAQTALSPTDSNRFGCWHLSQLHLIVNQAEEWNPETALTDYRQQLPISSNDLADCVYAPNQ